jgi:arylsulfate sulfotransferase
MSHAAIQADGLGKRYRVGEREYYRALRDLWFYAQHKPSFVTPNTSGKFSLTVFDNGDDREFASGVTCGATGAPPCLYSTVPILDLDETAKTATLVFHDVLAPAYSFFGGNAEVLANGNVEFDECAVSATSPAVAVYEVTQTATPQTVWQLIIQSSYAYRVSRMPSLYPGVQW